MISAVVFDLDGVIVDTAKYHYLAWKRLADQLNIPFDEQTNELLKGVSRGRSLEIILREGKASLSEQDKKSYAEQKNTWYKEYLEELQRNEILPGILSLLYDLKERGIKIALGSASKNSPQILEKLGLTSFFDVIVDGNSVSKAKPDPEVFLVAAQQLGVLPKNCIVIEDAQAGVEATIRAGMKVVGVGSEELLRDADIVLSRTSDIQRVLDKFT